LEDFEQHMLKDDADLCTASESFIPQYTDIKLSKSKKHNLAFHKRLFDAGLLRPVDRGRGHVTPFFVRKKNGMQQLILDCRRVNRLFRPSEGMPLGAGACWKEMTMDSDVDLYIVQSDIKDYFYACGLPLE